MKTRPVSSLQSVVATAAIRIWILALASVVLLLCSCGLKVVEVNRDYNLNWARRVAVLEFEATEAHRELGSMASDLFAKHLLHIGYDVVERQKLSVVLAEHRLNLSGAVNQEQIKHVGELSGVDALLTGSVPIYRMTGKAKKEEVGVTCRLIDVQTGEVIWVASDVSRAENAHAAADNVIAGIACRLKQYLSAAPVPKFSPKPLEAIPKTHKTIPNAAETISKPADDVVETILKEPETIPKQARFRQYKLHKSAIKILELMINNPKISSSQIADIIGLKRVSVKYNIKKLKKLGLLKRIGPARGGHWEVVE